MARGSCPSGEHGALAGQADIGRSKKWPVREPDIYQFNEVELDNTIDLASAQADHTGCPT
jgi:hypothetical protein